MRRLLSATVLAFATIAAVLPVTSAVASMPEDEDGWTTFRDTYKSQGDCLLDGANGVRGAAWDNYRCRLDPEKNMWKLQVQEDSGEGEEGGGEGGGETPAP